MQPKSVGRSGGGIKIVWQDGRECIYSGEYLRGHCPCAVCKATPGHPPPRPIPAGKVEVRSANPIGWYALQFVFSDGHDTGIYSYEMLRKICPEG
jgi:DUF971 family protein